MNDESRTTRDTILAHGKRLFWTLGYANVSVRDVTRAAGVDAALVSRYFGSKLGLFRATLENMDVVDIATLPDEEALVATIVRIFDETERKPNAPTAISLALSNARDPDAGPLVKDSLERSWTQPMTKLLGSSERAAMVTCVTFGMSVGEKMLHLSGIHAPGTSAYRSQVEHMVRAALAIPCA